MRLHFLAAPSQMGLSWPATNCWTSPAGTPADPNTPTLTSGKTSLSVSFNCPTGVWNSRFMTYELKRVDMGRSNVVVNADPSATTNVSPKLVRPACVCPMVHHMSAAQLRCAARAALGLAGDGKGPVPATASSASAPHRPAGTGHCRRWRDQDQREHRRVLVQHPVSGGC